MIIVLEDTYHGCHRNSWMSMQGMDAELIPHRSQHSDSHKGLHENALF